MGPARSPGWMITLADLLSLLVSFMVLLFAATTVPPQKWRQVVQPIADFVSGQAPRSDQALPETQSAASPDALPYVGVLLNQLIVTQPALFGAAVSRSEHRLILLLPPLPARIYGVNGDIEGSPADPRLPALAELLGRLDNRVDVVVHVTPPAGSEGPYWRQAVLESLRIAAALRREGDNQPIAAVGMVRAGTKGDVPDIEIVIHDTAQAATADTGNGT